MNFFTCATLYLRRINYGPVCLSVCVSVCLLHAGIISNRLNGSWWCLTQRLLSSAVGTFYTVLKGKCGISKDTGKGTSRWNFVPNFTDLDKFRNCSSTIAVLTTYTVDCPQFIALSVHLCVQHHWREAARRASMSAAAEAC